MALFLINARTNFWNTQIIQNQGKRVESPGSIYSDITGTRYGRGPINSFYDQWLKLLYIQLFLVPPWKLMLLGNRGKVWHHSEHVSLAFYCLIFCKSHGILFSSFSPPVESLKEERASPWGCPRSYA